MKGNFFENDLPHRIHSMSSQLNDNLINEDKYKLIPLNQFYDRLFAQSRSNFLKRIIFDDLINFIYYFLPILSVNKIIKI